MTGFAKFAERVTNPTKTRLRVARTRAEKKREKEKDDEAVLFSQWQEWHDKRKKELLAGPHGKTIAPLIKFLEGMGLNDGDKLVQMAPAFVGCDRHTKAEILALINRRCVMVRERNGLDPFDDDLTDSPATVFLQVRKILNGH